MNDLRTTMAALARGHTMEAWCLPAIQSLAGKHTSMMYIGKSFVLRGELSSGDDLHFDGTLQGHLSIDHATLTLGETATVHADIRAKQVIVHGTVHGSIAAVDRVELTATASVIGSVVSERVVIADGARFNGDVYMGRRTIARRVAQYKAEKMATPPVPQPQLR